MNYLTRIPLLFLFILVVGNINAQKDSIISILGTYEYEVSPDYKTIEFSFVENGVTCGPNTEFETVDEQYSHFLYEIINDRSVTDRIKELEKTSDLFGNKVQKSYSFRYESEKELRQMYEWAKEGFAENFHYYSHYEEPSLESQDELAINAYNIALKRAKIRAKILGYKKVEPVAVNDYTSKVGVGLKKSWFADRRNTSFDKPDVKKAGYSLRVNFRLQ